MKKKKNNKDKGFNLTTHWTKQKVISFSLPVPIFFSLPIENNN